MAGTLIVGVGLIVGVRYVPTVLSDQPAVIAYEASFDDSPDEDFTIPLASDARFAAEAMAAGEDMESACDTDLAYCVGVVTGAGRVDDRGLNQEVWELIEGSADEWSTDEVMVQVDLVETARAYDLRGNIDLFVDGGYDMIVTIGSDAAAPTSRAAEDNPEIDFLGVMQQTIDALPNYRAITGREVDVAAGLVKLASAASTEGVVGVILPPTTDPNYRLFESGARVAGLETDVTLVATHQPTSRSGPASTWAPKLVAGLIEEGADVIVVLGLSDSVGVVEVVGSAEPQVLCLASGADRWVTAHEGRTCLLTSTAINVDEALFLMVESLVAGEEAPESLAGIPSFSPFRNLESRVAADGSGKEAEVLIPAVDTSELVGLASDMFD